MMGGASLNSNQFHVVGAMQTAVGCVRTSNEDAVAFVIPSQDDPSAERGCLGLVADGMGGHAAGEVASALAVEVVRQAFFSLQGPVPQSLMRAFQTANRAIFEHARSHPECQGMGTTCTALVIHDGQLWLAHVGDSRAYLLRRGKLAQLTEDHTLHAQMIREGMMNEDEARTAEGGNVILKALGTALDIAPDVWEKGLRLLEDDTLLLCSDGLWNLVDDARIAEGLASRDPHEACQRLIDAALEAGGYDNISVGIFAVRPQNGRAAEPQKSTRRIKIAKVEASEKAPRPA